MHRDTENGSKKFDIKWGTTEVEHSTHYPKIKDKICNTCTEKQEMTQKFNKNLGSTVVEHSTHYPKIKDKRFDTCTEKRK